MKRQNEIKLNKNLTKTRFKKWIKRTKETGDKIDKITLIERLTNRITDWCRMILHPRHETDKPGSHLLNLYANTNTNRNNLWVHAGTISQQTVYPSTHLCSSLCYTADCLMQNKFFNCTHLFVFFTFFIYVRVKEKKQQLLISEV